jgi:hypothetical protein
MTKTLMLPLVLSARKIFKTHNIFQAYQLQFLVFYKSALFIQTSYCIQLIWGSICAVMKPFVVFSLVFLFHIAISSALIFPAATYEFQDKRFHFVDERLTFKQAIGECYKHGGSLAVPETSELNEFLGNIIAGKKEKEAFWFGGFHIDGTGKKVLFTNGKTRADYNFWINAEIGFGLFKTIYCLAMDGQRHNMSSDYEWKCSDCSTKKKFICEYEKNRLLSLCPTTTPVPTTTEIPTTTPRSAQTCPPDWVNFNSESCYKVLTLKFLR